MFLPMNATAFYEIGLPITCGLAAHAFCNRSPPETLTILAVVALGPPIVLIYGSPRGLSFFNFCTTSMVYLASLLGSIVAYRLSPFHPLARFPGPVLARVTRFWALVQFTKKKQHILSHELFEKYGDVVRSGPDHLLFHDARAIPVILGAQNPWPKHTNAVIGVPGGIKPSVLALVDPAEHALRRRLWDRAFTPSQLKHYEPLLKKRVAQLVSCLRAREGQTLDLAEWLMYMTLDYLGDFATGGLMNFMEAGGDATGVTKMAARYISVAEALGTIPWSRIFLRTLPAAKSPLRMMAAEVLQRRRKTPSNIRDLFYYLLDEGGESGHEPLDESTLVMEASLAIAAGSDTTATALANAMFHLITDSDLLLRLRRELDAALHGEDDDIDSAVLADKPLLNAVIKETLRLYPAVPNGVQRTPAEDGGSVLVAGHIVPVGTVCQVPIFAGHLDPRSFSPHPRIFWPERWLPEAPELAAGLGQEFRLSQQAYMPFNYGPGICVGRALAMQELRHVLAALVVRFDFQLAQGFGAKMWLDSLADQGLLTHGPLPVTVKRRVR